MSDEHNESEVAQMTTSHIVRELKNKKRHSLSALGCYSLYVQDLDNAKKIKK